MASFEHCFKGPWLPLNIVAIFLQSGEIENDDMKPPQSASIQIHYLRSGICCQQHSTPCTKSSPHNITIVSEYFIMLCGVGGILTFQAGVFKLGSRTPGGLQKNLSHPQNISEK